MTDDSIWKLSSEFLKVPADQVFLRVCKDDSEIYSKIQTELKTEVALLDRTITLLISTLQGVYSVKDKWATDAQIRTAVAMAGAVLNCSLLIRHSLFLGYLSESIILIRYCHERTTRCLAFLGDAEIANKFLSNQQINQEKIDRAIRNLDEQLGPASYDGLRKIYDRLCELSHPNLNSFSLRYGTDKLAETVGTNIVVGGIQSKHLAQSSIIFVLQHLLPIIRILQSKFTSQTGESEEEFKSLTNSLDTLKKSLY